MIEETSEVATSVKDLALHHLPAFNVEKDRNLWDKVNGRRIDDMRTLRSDFQITGQG